MEAWFELGPWDDKWLYAEKSIQDFGIMMYMTSDVSDIILSKQLRVEIDIAWQCPEDGCVVAAPSFQRNRIRKLMAGGITNISDYMTTDVSDIILSKQLRVEIAIAWQCPEDGWLCLNKDGACRGHAAAGCS
ncbi:hypothetical protein TSUD_353150 [Trifolium subterraneum]|nr:hypothetical protein TSUD_353150 [Trifolium subterraneum]